MMHIEEVKNNQFYQFPQWLLKEPYNVLSDKAKLIYMLLFDRRTLSVENKWFDDSGKVYMYFTNEQLGDVLKCSNKTIVKAKKELQEANLLKEVRQGINKPNRLYINGSVETTLQEVSFLPYGSVETTLQEVSKVHTINTNNINTNRTILIKDIYSPVSNETKDTIPYKEIIDYLNDKAKTKYRSSGKKTQTLIKARWKEGFKLADFKTVIDKKTTQWLHDAKMVEYLRPETLFGTKFESYLNQPDSKDTDYFTKQKGQRFSQAEIDEMAKPDPRYGF